MLKSIMQAQKHNFLQRGFTIVELIVVIVILGIIMSLAVVSVINSQVSARDTEREEDVQAIARQMEALYNETDFFGVANLASYPGVGQVDTQIGEVISTDILDGLDRRALFSPSVNVTNQTRDMSLRPATNTSENPETISPKPGQGSDVYVYQPFLANGSLCPNTGVGPGQECVRFNLYYWNEANNEVRKITSRNQ